VAPARQQLMAGPRKGKGFQRSGALYDGDEPRGRVGRHRQSEDARLGELGAGIAHRGRSGAQPASRRGSIGNLTVQRSCGRESRPARAKGWQ